jgi:hypothetical protein
MAKEPEKQSRTAFIQDKKRKVEKTSPNRQPDSPRQKPADRKKES